MRRLLFIGICVAALAAVCWGRYTASNDERAYFARDGHAYRVALTGWRFPLVHDPVSLLLSRTRKETVTMKLPRLEGVIDGTEIAVGAEETRYGGHVAITSGKMQVDLYNNDRRPVTWNGQYTLVPSDGTR
jgi:hypothetical protein